MAGEQNTLLSLLEDLGPAVAVERSFKMFEKTLLDNRLLFAFKPESIRQSPREAILTMGVRMGMQKDFLDVFEKERIAGGHQRGFRY